MLGLPGLRSTHARSLQEMPEVGVALGNVIDIPVSGVQLDIQPLTDDAAFFCADVRAERRERGAEHLVLALMLVDEGISVAPHQVFLGVEVLAKMTGKREQDGRHVAPGFGSVRQFANLGQYFTMMLINALAADAEVIAPFELDFAQCKTQIAFALLAAAAFQIDAGRKIIRRDLDTLFEQGDGVNGITDQVAGNRFIE